MYCRGLKETEGKQLEYFWIRKKRLKTIPLFRGWELIKEETEKERSRRMFKLNEHNRINKRNFGAITQNAPKPPLPPRPKVIKESRLEKIIENIKEYDKVKKKSAYVAGAITGVEGYKEKFAAAKRELENQGYTVFNPAELPQGLKYESYIKICKTIVEEIDVVFMLDNWKSSVGAEEEHIHATKQGKIILYQEDGGCGYWKQEK